MQPSLRICAALLSCLSPLAGAAQAPPPGSAAPAQVAPAAAGKGSALTSGPETDAAEASEGSSGIHLTVVVTDKSGTPVSGLDLPNFTLLDNDQPAKILSFHAFNGSAGGATAPVKVILLFDTVNTRFDAVSYTRQQVDLFLRQNGGRLRVPVLVYWLTNDGVEAQGEPTLDGNALAAQVDAYEGRLRSITRSAGAYGAIERFQFSTKMLDQIVRSEAAKPGRKLLIWAGPGWPLLDAPGIDISNRTQRALFGEIVQLSTLMREAHLNLYSISEGMPGPETFLYQSFLKGVRKVQQANLPNLSLKVLAVQSGGSVLPPTNDLRESINTCLRDAAPFYTLSFEPAPADRPDEYHEVKVRVGMPGLTARTNTGYYGQPSAP
jgi:VWFA-related protein